MSTLYGPGGEPIKKPVAPNEMTKAQITDSLINQSIRLDFVEVVVSAIADHVGFDAEQVKQALEGAYELKEDEIPSEGNVG